MSWWTLYRLLRELGAHFLWYASSISWLDSLHDFMLHHYLSLLRFPAVLPYCGVFLMTFVSSVLFNTFYAINSFPVLLNWHFHVWSLWSYRFQESHRGRILGKFIVFPKKARALEKLIIMPEYINDTLQSVFCGIMRFSMRGKIISNVPETFFVVKLWLNFVHRGSRN